MTAGDLVEIANLIIRADRASGADAHPVADIRFPEDQGPFGFPIAKPPNTWRCSEQTFTVRVDCPKCGGETTSSGTRVRIGEQTVAVTAACDHCYAWGDFTMDRAEFERRFPDAKL